MHHHLRQKILSHITVALGMNSGSITGPLVPLGTLAFIYLSVLGIDATLGSLGFLMTRSRHKLEFRLA